MQNTVSKLNDKLTVYQGYLEKKGYNQINLDIILREGATSINKFDVGGVIELPPDLKTPFTPLGNPPEFMSAYGISGEIGYAMVFRSQDTAVNLTIAGNKEVITNPLMFMHILEEKLSQILIETRDNIDALDIKLEDTPMSYSLGEVIKIEQIDTILYSFLTNRPVLLVGPIDQGVNVLVVFLSLIPDKFRWKYGFSINMPYFSQESINFGILDNVTQYNLEDEVNIYLENNHSMVNLYENTAYGEYTCNYTKKIVDALRNDTLEEARQIVDEIYTMAKDVADGQSAQNFGDSKRISYDDADLIVDIATHVIRGGN